MSLPFLTVGHSDRSIEEFLDLIRGAGVQQVEDVRRLRGSRRSPQFNEDPLRDTLEGAGIAYRPGPALAGRRPRSNDVPPEVNGVWNNQSFHNYADYALTDEFAAGLARLRRWGAEQRTAVMCSEAVWWRCHRRLIADRLLAAGEDVRHLGAGRDVVATLTPGAVLTDDGTVTYPVPTT